MNDDGLVLHKLHTLDLATYFPVFSSDFGYKSSDPSESHFLHFVWINDGF
jgi:hypothetical protein